MPKYVVAKNKKKKRLERRVKGLKQSCVVDLDKCGRLIPEENMSCVSKCLSEECHEIHFARNPLEDGEVDFKRWSAFENCVKRNLRDKKR